MNFKAIFNNRTHENKVTKKNKQKKVLFYCNILNVLFYICQNKIQIMLRREDTRLDELMSAYSIKSDSQLAELLGMSPQLLSAKLKGRLSTKTLELLSTHFMLTIKGFLK